MQVGVSVIYLSVYQPQLLCFLYYVLTGLLSFLCPPQVWQQRGVYVFHE